MLKYNEFIGHDYYELKPILSNGKLLKLDIKINKNYGILETKPVYIKISFIDSYNILPHSLDKLSKDFDVEISDGNTTPLSVPFNTVYTSWGNMERISISSVKSIIKINIFDEKIKYQV